MNVVTVLAAGSPALSEWYAIRARDADHSQVSLHQVQPGVTIHITRHNPTQHSSAVWWHRRTTAKSTSRSVVTREADRRKFLACCKTLYQKSFCPETHNLVLQIPKFDRLGGGDLGTEMKFWERLISLGNVQLSAGKLQLLASCRDFLWSHDVHHHYWQTNDTAAF